jgi:hypothetical protein
MGECPEFISINNEGTKLMFPSEGYMYEVYLHNIFPYDHLSNNGCMGVQITPIEEYVTIDWNKSTVSVTSLSTEVTLEIEWDRIYPIPS